MSAQVQAVAEQMLFTPEQVSQQFGAQPDGRPIISAHEIKKLAREGRVTHQRGPRNRILFTSDQASLVLDVVTQRTEAVRVPSVPPGDNPAELADKYGFRTSKRSKG